MSRYLRFVFFFIFVLAAAVSFGQAPTISYSSPQSYTLDSTITPLAPTVSSPTIIASGFRNSNGIAVDAAGNIYVADPGNNQIDKIPAGGGVPFAIGSGFSSPYGVAVDAAGNVYVADFGNGKLKKIPVGGGPIVTISSSDLNLANVAIDAAGNIYTTDLYGSNTVNKFPAGGGPMTTIGSGFNSPKGIATDAAGNIYIADEGNNAIKKIPAGGGLPITISTGFISSSDVAVDAAGNVYVADVGNQAVKEILAVSGATITIASSFPVVYIAVDNSGNVFATDVNNEVREIKPITSYSISAALPAGLSFDAVTGTISGTPTALSAATNYSVVANYNSGSISTTLNLGVILPPPIVAGPVMGIISACAGSPSASPYIQKFTVSGNNLSAGITVTAPPGFELSLSTGSGYSGNITLPQSGGLVNRTVIYVRSAASATGSISGNVTLVSAGFPSQNVMVTGTINALATMQAVSNQTFSNGATTTPVNFTSTGGISWVNNTPGIGLAASGIGNIGSFNAINTGSSPVTATITATPLFPGFAYVVNTGLNNVLVINRTTNAIISTIPTGSNPEGIVANPDGSKVYVSNANSNSITEINTITNSVAATFSAGSGPFNMAISPDGSRLYVTAANEVKVINTATNAVLSSIIIANPVCIVISPDGGSVYVSSSGNGSNTVSIINTATNAVVSTITVPNPAGMAISPDGGLLYVVNNNVTSTVSVINTVTNAIVSTIPVGSYPYAISISPDGSRVYVTNANSNDISVINTTTSMVIATIPVGLQPTGISVSPDGSQVYVTNRNSNGTVSVINTTTNLVSTITGFSFPTSISNIITNGANCSGAPITFTITVNPALTNASLASLTLSTGTLTPSFSTGITSYATSVSNAVSSITITPTASDAAATVKVNGTAVAPGSASGSLSLQVGLNTVTTIVTAQDGITTQTYTVTVTRAAPPPPSISYSSPQTYTVNVAITPLSPGNTGGAVPVTTYAQVSTFAGSGAAGSVDGTGTAASFFNPYGIATDPFGNIYVADFSDGLIRKITAAGVVSTFAGNGSTNGSVNGIGTAASFQGPDGLATDAQGNVYVAEYAGNLIRKITPAGVVSTLAGSGSPGAVNGTGTAASFNLPFGVATDTAGNVYVSDQNNNMIRKITPAGVVSTLAGSGAAAFANGIGTAASFNTPQGLTVDAQGNIYVADDVNAIIRKITPGGIVSTFAGSGSYGRTDGAANSASFTNPTGITIDASGNIYVADAGYSIIRKITPAGLVSTIAGNAMNGLINATGILASFSTPEAIASDGQGNLFIADRGNELIRKLIITGYTISPALPAGLAFDATTGIISGTPTVTSPTTTYTITAYNTGGSSTATLNISVNSTANANLANLAISSGTLSPSFATGITNYTASVSNAVSSIKITPTASDPAATVKVNGTLVPSGTASASLPLQVGVNTITTIITAQDGITTQTYTVNITRAASANADLAGLTISSGTLTPVFAAATTAYTASVANAISSITITPTVSDANATLTVNGVTTLSGNASAAVPLNIGSNTITVIVTAQDGVTAQTYTVIVTRAASANANLASLTISSGTLTPVFAATTTTYTASVANAISSITITPTVSDANATLTVNGVTTLSGNASAAVPLNIGSNTITAIVTAQDGTTTQTYTVNVNRAIPGIFTLPPNNFELTVTSATCQGSTDGSVSITAAQSLSYTATITGNGLNASYPFTASQVINNLAVGSYSVCISVAGQSSYQQCFDVVITQPADLSVYATVADNSNSVNLALSGGVQYNITLNGMLYTTSDNAITLPLRAGDNDLVVATDKLCQGTVEKHINISGQITPYPVPFQNTLNINLGIENINNVSVEIHNVSDGRMVFSKQLVNQSGVLQLDVTNLDDGIYALHVTMDNSEKIFKIQKK